MTARRPFSAARSYLYVPGDQRDKLAKADSRGADAVIIDLEDGVAPSAKAEARRGAARRLDEVAASGLIEPGLSDRASTGVRWWVRCNGGDLLGADLAAVVRPGLAGVLVPKVAAGEQLARLDAELARLEAGAGLAEGSVCVVPLVESGAGLLAMAAIAASPRVAHLSLGEVDLAADLGLPAGCADDPGGPVEHARNALVIVSAASGIDAPIGGASTDFRDLERFRASSELLRRRGFWGRKAIHPAQVPVINEVFSIASDEAARAAEVVERYDAALGKGEGAVLDAEGRMLDEAVVRIARRTLARAKPERDC